MIQGHIDFVSRVRVEGWVASRDIPMRGQRVLAFVDETCVGGGLVDVFRQDLADAGWATGSWVFASLSRWSRGTMRVFWISDWRAAPFC